MESLINYYYGITPIKIKNNGEYYLIHTTDELYLLVPLIGSIEEVESIINNLNKTKIKYHLLVLTKDDSLFITYEEKNYCLLKVRCDLNDKVSLFEFSQIKEVRECHWSDIWNKRIDYYESQIEELIKEPNIKYAMQYYIGLTEIAIYYGNVLKEKYQNKVDCSLCHKKITSPNNLLDYYNPLNMLIDVNIRDLAEYFKAAFFNETLTNSELLNMINNIRFDEISANYLFLRLLYPSYFFNLYDDYIETKVIDKRMLEYIKKSKEYESLLSEVYNRLSINNKIIINLWFIKSLHL